MNEIIISIAEAARLSGVTRQAIYVSIKSNRLKATRDGNRWKILVDDLVEYRKTRYSREFSIKNGRRIYQEDSGTFSIAKTAKILGVPVQKIYYCTRRGILKAHREGCAWVIDQKDIEEFKEKYLKKRKAYA